MACLHITVLQCSSRAQPVRPAAAAQQQRLPAPVLGCRKLPCCRRRRAPPASAAAAAAAGGVGEPLPQVEADTIIDPDGTVRAQPQSAEDRRDLWKRAIKLPMYSVGWAPILVSAAAAYVKTGACDPTRTLLLCVAATAIIGWLNLRCGAGRGRGCGQAGQAAANLHGSPCCRPCSPCTSPTLRPCALQPLPPLGSNDVFDGLTGVDKSKPESMVAMLGGNARLVFGLATALLLGGASLLYWLLQAAVRAL